MAKGRGIFLGLLLASLAQLLALFLSGAGHGWTTPLLASLLLWVVTPAAFILASRTRSQRSIFLLMAIVAVMADAWLIKGTIDEATALPFYLEVNGIPGFLIVGTWIGLWLLWQVIVIRALLFGRKGNE